MKISVVAGGPSTEANVSRVSARAVAEGLKQKGHEVVVHELVPELSSDLVGTKPDVVFPIVHGELGEDGCLQGLLEILGLPYVGSGVLACALAADKSLAKLHFDQARLPLARGMRVERKDLRLRSSSALRGELETELGPHFIVKPGLGGSAIGISRVMSQDPDSALEAALSTALDLDPYALIESLVEGADATCGVLETDEGCIPLPPTLIVAERGDFYDYTSKYAVAGSRHQCPAPFPPELTARLQAAAVTAHKALSARDLSRTDFVVRSDGSFVVLELNPLPGMTEVSLFPEAAAAAGISFPELMDGLVRRARERRAPRVDKARALPS